MHDAIRSAIFNYHSVRSVIIEKLRTKSSQIKTICEYKIDSGRNGNLIPIKMLKVFLPDTEIADLNKSIDKKVYYVHTTHVYHKWACAKL